MRISGSTEIQEQILKGCTHVERERSEVRMGSGEILLACVDCWNQSVHARRDARKAELAEYWTKYRADQSVAMERVGAFIGQRVTYFCASMLGAYFGGIKLSGLIVANRNGVAVIRLDRPVDGRKSTAWHNGWKPENGSMSNE